MKVKRDSVKESKILSILYHRRLCRRFIRLLAELNSRKVEMFNRALTLCLETQQQLEANNKSRYELDKARRKKARDEA
jgi:hypothetical protein